MAEYVAAGTGRQYDEIEYGGLPVCPNDWAGCSVSQSACPFSMDMAVISVIMAVFGIGVFSLRSCQHEGC